jgi:hypothetical protein
MPEGPEVELENVHETIHHEAEHAGGPLLRWIALTTSLLAALAAVASLQAGHTVNEALLLKTEDTRLQAEASDQWAYFQEKGIKSAVQEVQRAVWVAGHQTPPPSIDAKVAQYAKDQEDIKKEAEAKEKERDARALEADGLLAKHHLFADAVALFQVAIALGAVSALTRLRLVWLGSMALGLVGVVLFVMANLR